MFPTDHCRLVSIFRGKVRWRSEHVYTRITMEFLEGHWGAREKLRGATSEGRSARGKLRGANCEGREVSGNSEGRKADIDCPARYLRYVWRTIAVSQTACSWCYNKYTVYTSRTLSVSCWIQCYNLQCILIYIQAWRIHKIWRHQGKSRTCYMYWWSNAQLLPNHAPQCRRVSCNKYFGSI